MYNQREANILISQKPRLRREGGTFRTVKSKFDQWEAKYGEGTIHYEFALLDSVIQEIRSSAKELDKLLCRVEKDYDCSDVRDEMRELRMVVNNALLMTQGGHC